MKNRFAYLKDDPPPAQTHPGAGPAARVSLGEDGAAGEPLPWREKQPAKRDRSSQAASTKFLL